MNQNARASELIEVTEAMIEVVEQENTLLSEGKVREIPALQDAKKTIASLYESRLREIAGQSGFLEALEPPIRDRLLEVGDQLQQAARRNANALRAAMEMNRKLLDTIANSVRKQQVSATGYTRQGAFGGGPAAASGRNLSVSLNKQF